MNEPNSLTIKQACARMGIACTTWPLWEDRGLAPRRTRMGGRKRDRISVDELLLWEGQRDRDRVATGKPHLRHPLVPLSWTPEGVTRQVAGQLWRVDAGSVEPLAAHAAPGGVR